MKHYTKWSVWFITLMLTLTVSRLAWAQANLENPQANSFQSGIGVVSGWVCRANRVEIVFDSFGPFQASSGLPRGDTQTVCDDTDNGFGFLVNWNLLGDGQHTVRVLADGVLIGEATITVRTFGTAFLTGGSTVLCRVPHVPVFGSDTYIRWQQSLQNFAIERVVPHDAQYQGPECASDIATVTDDGTSSIDTAALQVALRDLPLEFLSADENASLTFMREEEKLAHDIYTLSFSLWNQQIFQNIAAEVGDRVKAGTVLATMHSQVIHIAWADYRKAVADRRRRTSEVTYAQQMEARAQRLYTDKALPLQEVQRTQVERVAAEEALNMVRTEVRRAEEALEHLGITSGEDPSGESGEYIPITTSVAGAVLDKTVTVGTAVIPGSPLFVVSDLSTLWAVAEVDETRLPLLTVGRPVEVRVAAYPEEVFAGTIIFVSDTFDPRTRRVSVRCRVSNPQGRLKPQMYATLSLDEGEARSVIVAPASAVQSIDGKTVVFVAQGTEQFSLRAVTVGPTQNGWTEVLSGVQTGEQVVTSGSFLLKSELQKRATPEEHS